MTIGKVLIVEDDALSRRLLCRLVNKLGHTVLQVENVKAAVDVLQNESIDVVIADFEMPDFSGMDLLKHLKSEFPRLPFILVTAYSSVDVLREAWLNGAFDFLQKPVFVDRLKSSLHLAIEYGHIAMARPRFLNHEQLQADWNLINVGVIRELAIALGQPDLEEMVEFYDAHSRIELEQLFRFHDAGQTKEIRELAHRMSGSAINLGLVNLSETLKAIEIQPEQTIEHPEQLLELLEQSLVSLKDFCAHHFDESAA